MAYYLYKYLKRKREEKKSGIVDDSHLNPELAQRHGQARLVSLDREEITTGAPKHTVAAPLTTEENARIKEEGAKRRRYRWRMILGLLLPNFLAAVDLTIVAPAVPVISTHFNQLGGSFNWIVSAYTLTFTTFVPISGQIADIYGRHSALQFNMFFILLGSVLCAASVSWGMLLLGRALQGVGAAGIINVTRIVLSDNVSLADNSKNSTVFSLINGISYAVGPVIGGYLASASWRYCFVLPIPIAFVSMIVIFFLMRKDLVKGRVSAQPGDSRRTGYIAGLFTFDWPGMIFFIFGVGLVILAIMWGGTQYKWSSPATIAPLVIGGLLWIIFYVHEYLLGPGRFTARVFPRQVAMMPSYLYRKKDTSLLMIINFATGVSLVSAFYFISIYWELAEGYSASNAGIQLLYYTPGLGVGVYMAMFLCNVWPRQTFYALFTGSVIETVGLALLTWAVSTRHKSLVNGMLALAGAGTGLRFMPVVLHAAALWPTRMASIQSLMSFMVPLGETIGISMMGAVFTNTFNHNLQALDFPSTNGTPSLNNLDGLSSAAKDAVQNAAAKAVMWAFVAILPFMGLSLVAACFLGNVWIGRDAKKGKKGEAGTAEVKGKILYGVYLKEALSGGLESNVRLVERQDGGRGRERVEDVEMSSTHGDSFNG